MSFDWSYSLLLNFFQSIYHFLLVPCYYADVEADFSELFSKSESNSITATSDDDPCVFAIARTIIFLGEDHFYETPQCSWEENRQR